MADELSELDQLIESDVLEALGEKVAENSSIEIDGITIEDIEPVATKSKEETLEENPEEVQIDENPIEENVDIEPVASDETTTEALEEPKDSAVEAPETEGKTVNTNDLASLLSELLNNKTIEITIKVKD